MLSKAARRLFSLKTQLHDFHVAEGAKMVPFCGYTMPVSYPLGTKKEHLHTREHCGLFDVSHMGQVTLRGPKAAALLEKLTVVDTSTLAPGNATLSLLMSEKGTIVDDCIITKVSEDEFFMVLNAGCKDKDLAHINSHNTEGVSIEVMDRSLVAV